MDGARNRAGRFSLLLLEDGEVLISDISCRYRLRLQSNPSSEGGVWVEELSEPARTLASRLGASSRVGRVKVATRSIFFDSDDWRDPVVKIPISALSRVHLSRSSSNSLRIQNNGMSSKRFSQTQASSPQWKPSRPQSADFSRISSMTQGCDPANSNIPPASRTESVIVDSKTSIFQREDGVDHPYVEANFEGQHVLTPLYTEASMLEAELHSLKSISAIGSRRARESALRELVRERETHVPFDITSLQLDLSERTEIDFIGAAVYALSRAPGRVRVSSKHLYFMPIHGDASRAVVRIPVKALVSIRRLRHGCKDAALEVEYRSEHSTFTNQSSSNPLETLMLTFQNTDAREHIFATLERFANKKLDIYGRNELDLALAKWRRGELSNYDYLMYLNFASGRSFNDLSQYPVFPWILSDYSSKELDLENPDVFRDLTKPIGALNNSRLAALKERYIEMPPPRFFYGTHYSTPAYLINYLVRAAPGAMLRLQNGRFDMPDRLFHSIAETWNGVCMNPADVKELIPEFYTLNYAKRAASGIVSQTASPGQFLDNFLGLELGTRQDGKRVDSVELPPWANGSSEKFVRKLRKALESRIASENLHYWIDLIFGVTSRSEAACNIFYTDVALPKSINAEDMESLTDDDINQMETIYLEFGRTPEQLFFKRHPPRFGSELESPSFESQSSLKVITVQSIGEPAPLPESQAQPSSSCSDALASPNVPRVLNTRRNAKSLPHLWETTSRRKSDNALLGRLQKLGRELSSHRRTSEQRSPSGSGGAAALGSCPAVKFKIAKNMSKTAVVDSIVVNLECGLKPNCTSSGSPSGISRDSELQNDDGHGSQRYALCTLSKDHVLRVQLRSDLIRARTLRGCSAICAMGNGQIAYGTREGAIGYYQIASGRAETLLGSAHETSVERLVFVPELGLLVSGSRDASVKVWQFQQVRRGPGALLRALELDAESRVVELTAARDNGGAQGSAENEDLEWAVRQLLIAALTADGALLVWRPHEYSAGDRFPDPVWRVEAGAPPRPSHRRLVWVAQGPGVAQALACVSVCNGVVRVAAPVRRPMRPEVVVDCPRATCVSARTAAGTLLVGSGDGVIIEFDSTGRELRRQSGLPAVHALLARCDGRGVVAVCGGGEAVEVTF